MVKVKASLKYKDTDLLSGVTIDVPKEHCNRDTWNAYIKKVLLTIIDQDLDVSFDANVEEQC